MPAGSWSESGILKMAGSGREFVIDCLTGKLIPKDHARYIGRSKKYGGPFWINNQDDLAEVEDLTQLVPSAPRL